jgi:hypothetical protein
MISGSVAVPFEVYDAMLSHFEFLLGTASAPVNDARIVNEWARYRLAVCVDRLLNLRLSVSAKALEVLILSKSFKLDLNRVLLESETFSEDEEWDSVLDAYRSGSLDERPQTVLDRLLLCVNLLKGLPC